MCLHAKFITDGVRIEGLKGLGSSGVTRVKGQPGQLTNKQLSRRSAERSWMGEGAAHRNPPSL